MPAAGRCAAVMASFSVSGAVGALRPMLPLGTVELLVDVLLRVVGMDVVEGMDVVAIVDVDGSTAGTRADAVPPPAVVWGLRRVVV